MDLYFNESLENIRSVDTTPRDQCRICLTEVVGEHHQLCACKGHLQNIHLKCLLEWLKRSTTEKQMAEQTKKCQICKEEILLDISKSYSCSNLSDIIDDNVYKNHCGIDTKFCILLCLFFVPLITMAGVIVSYTQNEQTQKESLYLIISMGLLSLFALIFLIRCFFIKENYELKGVKQKGQSLLRAKHGKVAVLIE